MISDKSNVFVAYVIETYINIIQSLQYRSSLIKYESSMYQNSVTTNDEKKKKKKDDKIPIM